MWTILRKESPTAYWGVLGTLGWIARRDLQLVTAPEHDRYGAAGGVLANVIGLDAMDAAAAELLRALSAGKLTLTERLANGDRAVIAPVRFGDLTPEMLKWEHPLEGSAGWLMAEADVRKLWPTREPAAKPVGRPPALHHVMPEWEKRRADYEWRILAGDRIPKIITTKESCLLADWYLLHYPRIEGNPPCKATTIAKEIGPSVAKLNLLLEGQ